LKQMSTPGAGAEKQ